ncbi:hypothetical protein BST81_04890 [Leptolyngbya sp. 'hensonii']|uniref:hypothetical protein n=1 Tax=Leptolyngbya sp. 'hensonii' TaxID=1922337 RepID=UPI00094FF926|nr:hypothetical protein [Leptolyngbya sp. 'hensonii']OLP19598.1 hypothetical protein BST81_04890 [Leptolyngbya sp. 'hensonii']
MADFLIPLAFVSSILLGLTLLVVGLFSAPWPILLLLLVLVLVSSQRLLQTTQEDPLSSLIGTPSSNKPDLASRPTQDEILIYRGVRLKRLPPIGNSINDGNGTEGRTTREEVLIYRGQRMKRIVADSELAEAESSVADKYQDTAWKSPQWQSLKDLRPISNPPIGGNQARKVIPISEIAPKPEKNRP